MLLVRKAEDTRGRKPAPIFDSDFWSRKSAPVFDSIFDSENRHGRKKDDDAVAAAIMH